MDSIERAVMLLKAHRIICDVGIFVAEYAADAPESIGLEQLSEAVNAFAERLQEEIKNG